MSLDFVAQVVYMVSVGRWRSLATGQFIAGSVVEQEVQEHVDAAGLQLSNLTTAYYAGQISLRSLELASAQQLKQAHIAQAMFGAGGQANMTQSAYGRVGARLKREYQFLRNFMTDIAGGSVSEAQAQQRMAQYANNTGQEYWNEWSLARASPELAHLNPLTRVPRDGSTECRGRCKCTLEEQTDGIYWQLHADESCIDCVEMAAGSPWRPDTTL